MPGVWLRPLDNGAHRDQAATLVAEADTRLWSNPEWRNELANWVHSSSKGDGLPVPALVSPFAQAVLRVFDLGGGVAAKDRVLAQGSPLLAVLGTDSDTPRDWLHAGMALQQVLLVANAAGLQSSYLNQPIQVPELRSKLLDLTEARGFPQVFIRLGYPDDVTPPSPRRPLDEVILWT